jgi:hypothetical protein
MRAYVLLRPALTPCGGSLVNLIELCRRLMGNFLCSSVVIQILKFSFTFSAEMTYNIGTILIQNVLKNKLKKELQTPDISSKDS